MIDIRSVGSNLDFHTQIFEFRLNGEPIFFFHMDQSPESRKTFQTLEALIQSINSRQTRQRTNEPLTFHIPNVEESQVFIRAFEKNLPIHYCQKDWLVVSVSRIIGERDSTLEVSLLRI